MGCFFGCFRVKDSKPNLVAPHEPAAPCSKNALQSLFQCDDESLQKGEEGHKSLPEELDVKELKEEANILKACGTLPETPVEIRKALAKWEGKSSSLVDSPSSCVTDGQNTRSDKQNVITALDMPDSEAQSEISAVSDQVLAPSVQRRNKSVRFNCESATPDFSSKASSSECVSQHLQQSESAGDRSVTKPSPYPTPLKLTDEMQTPGTEFGKITKVRSQYVNSVINPVEDPSQWKELKDKYSDSNDKRESVNLNDEDNVMSTPMAESTVKQISIEQEMKNEASLADWLKPVSPKQEGINERFARFSRERVYRVKAPRDRPILGMVAAHWNEEETSQISPKWWDGNGIPNSTNKYKEDQKVSWHATPFEERLEKALSEESFVSQRKPIGRTPTFDFDETEESDTAFSHLQSPDHIKSVVSF